MEALQSLLTYLTKTTGLVADNKIEAWGEDGKFIFTPGMNSMGYEVVYTANFEMSDVKVDPVKFGMYFVHWMNVYIPDRENHGLGEPEFFVEPLSGGKFDLGLRLQFREQINLIEDPLGEWLLDDGKKYKASSDFGVAADLSLLEIVDSHTQDTGLKN